MSNLRCILLFLLSFFISPLGLFAQTTPCDRPTYNEFITKAQNLVTVGDYIQAFQYYNSAKDYCPQESAAVDALVAQLIARIAEDQQAAEAAKQTAEAALAQAQKLIDAFYFYDDKFALAFKDNRFYFIDKNGDEVKYLGRWKKAEQFDAIGYAKVKQNETDLLLDTLGNSFQVAYTIAALDDTKTALDLRGTALKKFPKEILAHPGLQVLILDGNSETPNTIIVPDDIDQLSKLQHLHLSYCELSSFPQTISKLMSLTRLHLSGNTLTNIPESIGQLSNLTDLSFFNNELIDLPESLGQLQKLSTLNLNSNQLTSLPESIGQLKELTKLSLGSNKLTELPQSIGQLSSLQYLSIQNNQLNILPESIGQLSKIVQLFLGQNQLLSLPDGVTLLTQLKTLDLSGNDLTSLPENIGNLTKLTTLTINSNRLNTLPESIGNLSNLKTLFLSGNALATLPESFGGLASLKSLILGGNKLIELPENIGQLKNLPTLNLADNQLTTLPESIGQLTNLEGLILRSNQLKALPESLGQLESLIALDLGQNQLVRLPESFGSLQNLGTLFLQNSQLTNLPESFGQLKNLSWLSIDNNQLTSLPESFCQLVNLKSLNLAWNPIHTFPECFQQLSNLESLTFSGNWKTLEDQIQHLRSQLPNTRIRPRFPIELGQKADQMSSSCNYSLAFQFCQKAAQMSPQNLYHLHQLSFYALFVGEYDIAIQAAKKLQQGSIVDLNIEKNLALAYLLNDQWEAAEAIYKTHRYFPVFENPLEYKWGRVFLEDITELEAAGVYHDDFARAKALLEE